MPAGGVSAAITAYAHHQVLKWIYAQRRRLNPNLPGALQLGSTDQPAAGGNP